MTFYVYGLAEDDGPIRYVGKSTNPARRLDSHRSASAAAPVRAWIAAMSGRVTLRILAQTEDQTKCAVLEQEWVKRLSPGLLNSSVNVDTRSAPRRPRFEGIGKRCLARRTELGLSQLDVSRRVGLPQGQLCRLETGNRPHISAETAVMIARAIECSVEWLVTGEERVTTGAPVRGAA